VPAGPRLARLDHVVIAVTDWERSNRFYTEVLGADLVERGGGWAYRLGEQQLNVHGPGVSPHPIAATPVSPGGSDLCFVWPGTIADAVEHLARHDVTIEEGPVERDGAAGSGRSVYFRDPDGSLLELISYEPD
jgi:catechol 2,3-dioxygenase-like lactoylglutathione lyase family enzyme